VNFRAAQVPLFAHLCGGVGWRVSFAACGGIMLALVVAVVALLNPSLSEPPETSGVRAPLAQCQPAALAEAGGAEDGPLSVAVAAAAAATASTSGARAGGDGWDGSAWARALRLLRCRWYLYLSLSFFLCGVVAVGVRAAGPIAVGAQAAFH